jgi:hypothetical protein
MKPHGLPAITLSLLLAGCGDRLDASLSHQGIPISRTRKGNPSPLRYDATNETTMNNSSQAIMAAMTPEEAERFQADLDLHIWSYAGPLTRSSPGDETVTTADLMAPLHGLTAAEIHATAEAEQLKYREENKAAPKTTFKGNEIGPRP